MMKRIAAPMVGGMISSTLLTLIVIPAVYSLWRERQTREEAAPPGGEEGGPVPEPEEAMEPAYA